MTEKERKDEGMALLRSVHSMVADMHRSHVEITKQLKRYANSNFAVAQELRKRVPILDGSRLPFEADTSAPKKRRRADGFDINEGIDGNSGYDYDKASIALQQWLQEKETET